MSLSTVLFLFLAHLGVGIVFTLTLVSREAGVKFFRFNAGLASVLLVIALAFGYNNTTSLTALGLAPSPFDRHTSGIGATSVGLLGFDLQLLVMSTVAIVVYWATVGRSLARIRPGILWFSVVTGTLAILVEALALTVMRSLPTQILTVASF